MSYRSLEATRDPQDTEKAQVDHYSTAERTGSDGLDVGVKWHDEREDGGDRVTVPYEQPEPWPGEDDLPIDDLARLQGVKPVASLDDLAQPDLWESDGEYEAFLTDLYASRRSDAA